MTQTTVYSTQSAFPLPDVFSDALTGIVKRVQPGIVQVRVAERGGGTGVIWSRDGRIITNNHVVARDDARVQVLLVDGRILEAKVLQRNPKLDLALLKVTGENLKALAVGDSSQLRIGEWAFAIGHPWGQRWAVTAGIVSAISSVKLAEDLSTQYIKSDVRLAPGNSGGPLLNADGDVVGINAMIFGGDLSVSIPSNVVSTWLASLPKGRITLGIEIQQVELPGKVRQRLQPQRAVGLLIVGLRPERQVLHNDLLIGDILLEVGGKAINDVAGLRQILAQGEEGKDVTIQLVRGGEIVELDIGTVSMESSS